MTTLDEARQRDRAAHVYMVDVTLKNSGPALHLSTRAVTSGGVVYEDYIASVKSISTGASRLDSSSLLQRAEVGFKNEPYGQYPRLVEAGLAYPFEGAGCVVSEGYLMDDGTLSDAAVVFRGVLERPVGISEHGFSCGLWPREYYIDERG